MCGALYTMMKNNIFLEGLAVNGETFIAMINTALCHISQGTVFQLDGAAHHISLHVCPFLDGEFSDHWSGRAGPIPWPLYSPDLVPEFFFSWVFVEGEAKYE